MRDKSNESSGFWLVWPIILLTIFVAVIFTYSLSKETKKKKQVEAEINLLKEQADKIAKENMALQDRVNYLGSEDYQKIQAKDKLGLQSPGENVVVIAPGPEKKEILNKPTPNIPAPIQDKSSNFKKWINYFFE